MMFQRNSRLIELIIIPKSVATPFRALLELPNFALFGSGKNSLSVCSQLIKQKIIVKNLLVGLCAI